MNKMSLGDKYIQARKATKHQRPRSHKTSPTLSTTSNVSIDSLALYFNIKGSYNTGWLQFSKITT